METKSESLKSVLAQIEKDLGLRVQKLSEAPPVDIETIRSGSFLLDDALGVPGYPRGRIIEVFGAPSGGKTSLALAAIASAQALGGTAAFIDVEHAFSRQYAQDLGVDVDNLYFVQPDYGEQALETMERLIASNTFDIIVLDSTAALVPKAEMEEDMEKQSMGLQAKLMSKACRKITPIIGKTKTVAIFINQIRQSMSMYGCFSYKTGVTMEDGSVQQIGYLVNNKVKGKVLSFNPKTQKIEARKITNWFNNGKADKFLQFTVEGGLSGKRGFSCTENHTIFTPNGEVAAGTLNVGDYVLSTLKTPDLTFDQRELIVGSLLGDGHLNKKNALTASFVEDHSQAQKSYVSWKQQSLKSIAYPLEKMGGNNGIGFRTRPSAILDTLHKQFYTNKKKVSIDTSIFTNLSAKNLAVWYQDDGNFHAPKTSRGRGCASICNTEFDTNTRLEAVKAFQRLGLGTPKVNSKGFFFSADSTVKMHKLISPFVHPSMDYKLQEQFKGKFTWKPSTQSVEDIYVTIPTKIISIKEVKPSKSPFKYDLEIEGNHTYLVGGTDGGVVVHNSPTTTPGGEALKFYSSVRLSVRKVSGSEIKEGTNILGHKMAINVVKNKVAPPMKTTELTFLYGKGIDKVSDLIEFALDKGFLEHKGHTYTFEDQKWVGRENAAEGIRSNPEIYKAIAQKVIDSTKPLDK